MQLALCLSMTWQGFSIGGGGSAYAPSLDFSDARNSQYLALLFEDF